MQLLDYVKVYRNAVPSIDCDNLVDKLDDHLFENHRSYTYSFKQINLCQHLDIFEKDIFYFLDIFNVHIEKYKNSLYIRHFPDQHGYEELRVKCYREGDFFNEHVDVNNSQTSKRFLSVFVYLNDGGGTKFLDKLVKSEKGTLVIFPPLWLFPHQGIVEREKYFLSTYLHYV